MTPFSHLEMPTVHFTHDDSSFLHTVQMYNRLCVFKRNKAFRFLSHNVFQQPWQAEIDAPASAGVND